MFSDALYNDINRTIIHRIRDMNSTARRRAGGGIISGGDAGEPGDGNICGCNEHLTCASFNDFDYRLIYDEEEDLIAVTSHSGEVSWILLRDWDEDLIVVFVTSRYIEAYIALIYEFFDVRDHLTWVSPQDIFDKSAVPADKGKLMEVILLQCNTYSFPERFEVLPNEQIIDIGTNFKYKAQVLWDSGLLQDVSDLCEWTIEEGIGNEVTTTGINRGVVTAGTMSGSYAVTATWDALIHDEEHHLEDSSLAFIMVQPSYLTISPSYSQHEVGEGRNFTAMLFFNNGTYENVTPMVTWEIAPGASIGGGFALSNNVGIFQIKAQVLHSGLEFSATAIYETIFVKRITHLEIRPDNIFVDWDEVATYRAYVVYNDNTDLDVTHDCGWLIDAPAEQNGQRWQFSSQVDGIYNVTAIYDDVDAQYTANAIMEVGSLLGHRYDYLVKFEWEGVHVFGMGWIDPTLTEVLAHQNSEEGFMVGEDEDNAVWIDFAGEMSNPEALSGSGIISFRGQVYGYDHLYIGLRTHDACVRRKQFKVIIEDSTGVVVFQSLLQNEHIGNGKTRWLKRSSGFDITDYTPVFKVDLTTTPVTFSELDLTVYGTYDPTPSDNN